MLTNLIMGTKDKNAEAAAKSDLMFSAVHRKEKESDLDEGVLEYRKAS